MRGNWQATQRRLSDLIPGSTFADGELTRLPIPREQEPTLNHKTRLGIPSLEAFAIVSRNPLTNSDPAHGHADFLVVLPRKASALHDATRVLYETFVELDMPPMHNPFNIPVAFYSRSFMIGIIVPTWRDAERNAQARALISTLMDRFAERGWAVYRCAPAFQDELIAKFSFNNNSLLRFQEKLKDGIDPNGIISPGRYGLWPANLRNNRA